MVKTSFKVTSIDLALAIHGPQVDSESTLATANKIYEWLLLDINEAEKTGTVTNLRPVN